MALFSHISEPFVFYIYVQPSFFSPEELENFDCARTWTTLLTYQNFFRPRLYRNFLVWKQLSASVWSAILANASSKLKKRHQRTPSKLLALKKGAKANQNEKKSQVLSAGKALDFELQEKSLLLLPNLCPFDHFGFLQKNVCACREWRHFFFFPFFTFASSFHY